MYDAYLQREVLVVAPVLCILADNSRSSELLNHMGSTANKYCISLYHLGKGLQME